MPIKRAKRVYRKRRGARRARRAGIPRSLSPRYQVATVVETFDPQVSFLDNVAINQITSLNMFKRCTLMSRLYEQFRIEEVKYTYTPLFNTFQESSASSPSAPVFYHVMDRLGSLNAPSTGLSDLTEAGATRRKFTSPIVIKYRPNTMVTTGVAQPTGASTQILSINGADYGRWFPCVTQQPGVNNQNTPNTLAGGSQIYQGHWVYIEQLLNPGTASASVTVQVRVSFKNPMINQQAQPTLSDFVYEPLHGSVEVPTYRVIGGED